MPDAERFYRVAYHILESEQDAEDAVQDLYLKLWAARDSLSGIKNPTAYGLSVLKNICMDRIRRRTVRHTEPLDAVFRHEDSSASGQDDAREKLKLLMGELDRLPEKQSHVLRLKALEGLDYAEISERTGLSQVHVRVLVSTARKTLKQKLKL